jgi:hypothetical protein
MHTKFVRKCEEKNRLGDRIVCEGMISKWIFVELVHDGIDWIHQAQYGCCCRFIMKVGMKVRFSLKSKIFLGKRFRLK